MIKKTAMIALVGLMLMATVISAGDEKAAKKAEHANFDGTLVCLACDLKATDGAHADCKTFGHTHALKTADGKYISLLENKFSADLFKGEKYHNAKMSVSGVYFAKANQLDVDGFTVDGKKMSWCDHCSAMDGCAAKKGGM